MCKCKICMKQNDDKVQSILLALFVSCLLHWAHWLTVGGSVLLQLIVAFSSCVVGCTSREVQWLVTAGVLLEPNEERTALIAWVRSQENCGCIPKSNTCSGILGEYLKSSISCGTWDTNQIQMLALKLWIQCIMHLWKLLEWRTRKWAWSENDLKLAVKISEILLV